MPLPKLKQITNELEENEKFKCFSILLEISDHMTEKMAVAEAGAYIAKKGVTTTIDVVEHLAEKKLTYPPTSVLERLESEGSINLKNGEVEITEEGLKRYSSEKKKRKK